MPRLSCAPRLELAVSGDSALGGGELGAGIEQAADDEGQDQVATAVALGAKQAIEADLARCAERCGDMPMRQRADDGDGLPSGGITVPPLSSILKPAMRSCGQSDRFSRVRSMLRKEGSSG
jgi:hypothetical protein